MKRNQVMEKSFCQVTIQIQVKDQNREVLEGVGVEESEQK
jgi:hypothetical protein